MMTLLCSCRLKSIKTWMMLIILKCCWSKIAMNPFKFKNQSVAKCKKNTKIRMSCQKFWKSQILQIGIKMTMDSSRLDKTIIHKIVKILQTTRCSSKRSLSNLNSTNKINLIACRHLRMKETVRMTLLIMLKIKQVSWTVREYTYYNSQ